MEIRRIIEQSDTPAGRAFDLTVQGLIVLSLVSFSLQTLPELSASTRRLLVGIEVGTVLLFSLEYLLRLAVAERKLRFVFSFYGLVDLLAVLPFYLALGFDLRAIRVVRLLRLFRFLKMFRYRRAVDRFGTTFRLIRDELILFLAACGVLLYVAALGIFLFERRVQPEVYRSVFDAMWWAVATLTTVGYGDMVPRTTGGRIFTTLILFVGLGIIAVPAGLIASAMTRAFREERGDGDAG